MPRPKVTFKNTMLDMEIRDEIRPNAHPIGGLSQRFGELLAFLADRFRALTDQGRPVLLLEKPNREAVA